MIAQATPTADVGESEDEILIKDLGPVEHVRIPIPKGGGIVVLTGDNGAGKSESLSAVRALLGSDEDRKALEPRDGRKSGFIEGCGRSINVALTNRGDGLLGVSTLEDRLDIWKLVDPHIKDANSADNVRLKALLRVTNAKASIDLFDHLLGNSIEIDAKYIHEEDLVTMAGGVKRALEAQARNEELAAESSGDQAALCLKSVEGVDLNLPSDAATLQASYQSAAQVLANLRAKSDEADKATARHQAASAALEKAKQTYSGPSVDEATLVLENAIATISIAQTQVDELTEKLRVAREQLAMAEANGSKAVAVHHSAIHHRDTIAAWQVEVDKGLPVPPSTLELANAAKAVDAATAALEQGAVVRQAKVKAAEAETWSQKRTDYLKKADQWRKSAASVDTVLSEQIASLKSPIKVGDDDKGLRLVIDHKRGKGTYFSELSEGERWGVVIPIAIKAVGKNGVFCCPQEAWEGIQPAVRKRMREQLAGSTVTMITAECADGPLIAAELTESQ